MAELGVKPHILTFQITKDDNYIYINEKLIKTIRFENPEIYDARIRNVLSFWKPEFYKFLNELIQKEKFDVMHCHEIWLPIKHYFIKAAIQNNIPLVITPHGSLTEWSFKHKHLKKIIGWHLYQKKDLDIASVIHATSIDEAEDLRKLGLVNPIALIQNGINIPPRRKHQFGKKRTRRALLLSRLNPKKGIELLLQTWAKLRPKGWELILCGPCESNYKVIIPDWIKKYCLQDCVRLIDPVYDEAKWNLYNSSDLFVLPTFSENFGIVIAEAMACEIPVITTHNAPWIVLNKKKCGWWIPLGEKPLMEALTTAIGLSDKERQSMGKRARKVIVKDFTWDKSARKMLNVYEWLLKKRPMPKYVYEEDIPKGTI